MTLQRDDFEYAGLNSRDDLQVEMGNVVLPSAPAMAEQVTDIPAMYGNQFNGTDFTSRIVYRYPSTVLIIKMPLIR
ncbi:hypothetical protein ACA593_03780 [Lactiplantibacillus pentosus]|uniref:hypothetical protein n=1 Tax=Lactiplantibacillus pentosus TaxID=1589 RepID=UPI003C247AA2